MALSDLFAHLFPAPASERAPTFHAASKGRTVENAGGVKPLPGSYEAIWEAKRTADPGSGNYAWSTYQFPLTAREGAGVRMSVSRATYEQMFAGQQVVLTGIPLTAGQVDLNPLYDPNAPGGGFTDTAAILQEPFQ